VTDTLLSVEEIHDALSAIVDDAEGRDLTDDEHGRIEALEKDLAEAQARRERTEAVRKRNAERKEVATKPLFVEAKPQRDTIEAAFNHYLRTGKENADLQELRNAQGVSPDSSGGFTVPEGFRQKLVDRMKAFGGLADVVEEITTSTGNRLPWPTLDDTGNVGQIVAEHGTFSGGADLAFGEEELGAYKYMVGGAGGLPLRISWELLQDSAFDVEDLVASKLGQRLARIQATHLVTGTGTGQPLGIVTGKTGIEPVGAEITYTDLLAFVHSVDPAYRTSARWAFNDQTLQLIRGIEDTNGRPILKGTNEGVTGGPGGETLLGYPVTIDQAFPNYTPADATINWGVFGDLREGYVIRRVRDIVVIVNPWTRAANGQVEYSAWARMDATQQNTHAYVALTGNLP
jgi:HK97 family phage major capsid protein